MGDITPIADREGQVGGIESMVVDGRRWFFGFDYSMDTAVSPLVDDPARMAEFASRHMLQRDGTHDVAYWRDLVDLSVGESGIVGEDEDRTYDSGTLAAQLLTPSTQLMYLLGAATAWDDGFFEDDAVQAALATIGVPERDREEWDCLDRCVAAIRSDDAEVRAAAVGLMTRYQRFIWDNLPANWPDVFAALRPA
ncbi:hypothetical protein ACQEVZ_54130 [Dactylosporangium sp. CA-152071]|uniref:hypothetical protein n=1 Tax=Dactylosporangium sp. CA-152071 TaxID=3239933 RepID=UPI003D8CE041